MLLKMMLYCEEEAAEAEEEEAGWSKKNKNLTWQCGGKMLVFVVSNLNPHP